MTMKNFLHYYHLLNGAQRYLLFFIYKKVVYVYNCKTLAPRWLYETRESSSNGGWQKWMLSLKDPEKAKLVKKAVPVMTIEEWNSLPYAHNKGHRCEYWLHKTMNLPGEYKPDHERFDKCGDVCFNGVQYQVKFQNASLTNVHTLANAQKDRRERRKAERKMRK